MNRKTELTLVPIAEGALLLALGGIGWALKLPLLFTSLGPTAYEQIEKPGEKSATPYNIIVGHVAGLVCGFIGLALVRAFHAPVPSTAGYLSGARVFSSVIGCVFTAFINLLLNASQPAAFSTTLLVTLGSYESPRDALTIVIAVLLLAVLGEPLRRRSLRMRKQTQ